MELLWLVCYLVVCLAKYIWETSPPPPPPPPLSYNVQLYCLFFSRFLSTIILFQSSYCITFGSWIKFTSQVDPNPDLHLIKYRIKPKKSAIQISGLSTGRSGGMWMNRLMFLNKLTWPYKTKGATWSSFQLFEIEQTLSPALRDEEAFIAVWWMGTGSI